MQQFNLDTLIAPIQNTAFLERYWELEPFHVRAGDPQRFTGIFSRADMDRLLVDFGHPNTLNIRLAKYENEKTEIVDVAGQGDTVDVNRVFGAYCDGFSVNLNDINERHVPARNLAISLSDTLGC